MDERELYNSRQHLAILIWKITMIVLLGAIMVFAALGIASAFQIEKTWPIVIAVVLSLIGLALAIYRWLATSITITDQRILIHKQSGLFSNELLSVNLNKIKETASEQYLSAENVFGFGTLVIMGDLELSRKQFQVENLPKIKKVKIYLDKIVNMVNTNSNKDDLPEFQPQPATETAMVEQSQTEPEPEVSEAQDENSSLPTDNQLPESENQTEQLK